MSISKTLVVSINKDKAKAKDKMYIYRNDVGVDMYIELSNLTYNFDGGKNNFKFANSLFKTPSGVIHTVNKLAIVNKRIRFSFTPEIVSLIQEIGSYELQFQLFDLEGNRLTIPSYFFEVKEPLGNTELDNDLAIVDEAVTDYSYIGGEEELFAVQDGYIKVDWKPGDIITSTRMNNIERGISLALSGEDSGEVLYSSDKPTTVEIGGIPLGYTNSGISIVKLIDDMLHPYKKPSISLSINPSTTLFELGSVASFTANVSVNKGSNDISEIVLMKDSVVLVTSKDNISHKLSNIVSDTTIKSYVNDKTNIVNSNNINIKFINPIYIGSTSSIGASDIKAMEKRVVNVGNQIFEYTVTNKRMCIAVPSEWTLKNIVDNNGFDITPSFTKTVINLYCLDNTLRAYTVYYSEPTSQNKFKVEFKF